uniref:Nucleoprotein n=1 Tax=Para molly bornavirus TaxID=3067900 RepID=A0AA48P9K2_9MONO|nr:TPA_asm: nucleoprotein [Para molly bornavirus]
MEIEPETLEIEALEGDPVHIPSLEVSKTLIKQVGSNEGLEAYIGATTGGSKSAGITMLMIMFPSMATFFGSPHEYRNAQGRGWINSAVVAPKPSERLFVVKAVFSILYTLIRGPSASLDQVTKRFSAMLASMEIVGENPDLTTKFSVMEVVSHLTTIGAKKKILAYLFARGSHPEFGRTATHMLTQLQMVARYGGMTTYEVIEEFLAGDVTQAHLLQGVGKDAVKFRDTVNRLQGRHGHLFPYMKVLGLEGHEELNSTAFPALTKVAIHAKRESEGSFKSYASNKALSNSACRIPESEIKEALKLRKKRTHVSPDDTDGIKKVCGIDDECINSIKAPAAPDLTALMAMLAQRQPSMP